MIAHFPSPYPDELWYSVCARFSDQMRFGTDTGVMMALYGDRHAIANAGLPHRLDAIISRLPAGHPCKLATTIDHHTFLPYYGPFLRTSTYADVLRFMEDGRNSSVQLRCGVCTSHVRLPRFFRSCPECNRRNRDKNGEMYWRRLFQLPGVEICPIHNVPLESSSLPLFPQLNRHRYISAESQDLPVSASPMPWDSRETRVLLDIARSVEWLLGQERLNPGLDFLQARHRELLALMGHVTRAGSIRISDLRHRVIACYGANLLSRVQCALSDDGNEDWLGTLFRYRDSPAAPLRHLLLLQALGVDPERFFYPQRFSRDDTPTPTRVGPWPCLNAVCKLRGKPSIDQPVPEPIDAGRFRSFIVKCPLCGFTYKIREGNRTPTRPDRVIDYGPVWKSLLTEQWNTADIPVSKIAKTLGVANLTVKSWASKLGLQFPRMGKRLVTKCGIYVPKPIDRAKVIESHRRDWIQLRTEKPAAGITELRAEEPCPYSWLYLNDRAWLMNHKPAPKAAPAAASHVNWINRDQFLSSQIAIAAAHIRDRADSPRRVTATAIVREIGKGAFSERTFAKLPRTRSAIRSVLESREDFALRRVHLAAAKLRESGVAFNRWMLVRAAGLNDKVRRRPEVTAALDQELKRFTGN